MKKVVFLLTLLWAGVVQAQDAGALIRTQLSQQTESWNAGDIEGFMQPYWNSDSLLFIGKSGVTRGWQQTLANYRKSYPGKEGMGQLRFDILEVKPLSADHYFVVGKWMLERKAGNLSGHFTLLFRNIAGSWKIVADHSS